MLFHKFRQLHFVLGAQGFVRNHRMFWNNFTNLTLPTN